MKIGIVSDTHSLLLPDALFKVLTGVNLILHAGDICDDEVLKQLSRLAPVKAVQGNMDSSAIKKKLPMRQIIECEGIKIGLCHGHVGVADALSNAVAEFSQDHVQCIVFGHSHQAYNDVRNKILLFNPGSPNDVVKARFFSCGCLTIQDGCVKGEIITL